MVYRCYCMALFHSQTRRHMIKCALQMATVIGDSHNKLSICRIGHIYCRIHIKTIECASQVACQNLFFCIICIIYNCRIHIKTIECASQMATVMTNYQFVEKPYCRIHIKAIECASQMATVMTNYQFVE